MTSPTFKQRNYRLFWVLLSWGITALKHLYLYKFSVRKVLRFAIEIDFNDAAFSWRPGTLLHVFGLKTLPTLPTLRFCYLTIPCLRINITLIFLLRSSSEESTHMKENSTTDVSVGFQGPKLYKFGYISFPNTSHMKYRTNPILGEAFCISLFIYFSFSRFWTSCIDLFASSLLLMAWQWKQRHNNVF